VILVSPWLDLTITAGTYVSREETDELFSAASGRSSAELYLQGHDAADPLASPLLASLDGFPSCLLFAGGREVLLDDTLEFAARLARAGSSVQLVIEEDMQHVFVTSIPRLPEARRAMETIAHFVRSL
jgi:acetyl esterase/lipase